MAWKNLAQDLSEEFQETAWNQEDLTVIAPLGDPESIKNYQRWYHKFVRYPKHKQKLLMEHKEWYAANREHVLRYCKEYYRKNKAHKLASNKRRVEQLRQTEEGRQKLREWHRASQKRYDAKVKSDPVKYQQRLESGRKRSKAYRERQKAMKAEWQNDHPLCLKVKEQPSEAVSDTQKVQNT